MSVTPIGRLIAFAPRAAARATRATTPLGAGAAAVYERFVESGGGNVDFSGIIRYLRGT